ncbi:MAG: hypothetical protein FJ207_14815 [Gemmatimonadetes bacterium]|nr:hypothetical protein [Gemmatimonadota bacterium]
MQTKNRTIAVSTFAAFAITIFHLSLIAPAMAIGSSNGWDSDRCLDRSAQQEDLLQSCLLGCAQSASPQLQQCEHACQRRADDAIRALRTRSGCSVDGFEPQPLRDLEPVLRIVDTPSGKIVSKVALLDGDAIFEGDIVARSVVPPPSGSFVTATTQGAVRTISDARWPAMTIPYWIDRRLPWPERVGDAIRHWEANTRVRFRAITAQEKLLAIGDFVEFTTGPGCTSAVGRQGGSQPIKLALGCATANVVHEIGHAIGLWHEQSRVDRDEYIRIHWDNLRPGMEFNFTTYRQMAADGIDLGPFDFDSIMIYPSFIRDPSYVFDTERPTITRHDGSAWARTSRLSEGDAAAVHLLYRSPVWIASLDGPASSAKEPDDGRSRAHKVFCLAHQNCLTGDVDGDARDDLIAVDMTRPHRAWAVLSDGIGFTPNPGAEAWSEDIAPRARVFLLGDVSGDGKSDLVALRGGRACTARTSGCTDRESLGDVFVALSDGRRFQPAVPWHDLLCTNEWSCHLGDVDGDGRADLVAFPKRRKARGVWVARSTGRSFSDPVLWHPLACSSEETCELGDVDGDSRADVVILDTVENRIQVARSTGFGFVADTSLTSDALAGSDTFDVGDLNADGRADVIGFARRDGVVRIAWSAATAFHAGAPRYDVCLAGESCSLADVSGDGSSEVVAHQP